MVTRGTETILLTEDEPALRALARHILELNGYTVLEVNTGGEFHGLMTTTDVDIAGEIVDETMRIARASAMRRLETLATMGD